MSSAWSHFANAPDIETWASSIPSRALFPTVVRRLIRQTNDQVFALQMKGGDAGDATGYDGQSEAGRATPFVPEGKVVWELGTGADPLDKANKDYRKRTADPQGVVPAETIFVFVTPRQWDDKKAWAARKRRDGVWRDVKAFDVYDLIEAFEEAPAVRYWFAELIGKPVNGVRTIENWWSSYSAYTSPILTPQLILAGRADHAANLLRLLEEEARHTLVKARSVDDVLAFVAATVMSANGGAGTDLLARTLIIHDSVTLRQLDGAWNLLILLPYEDHLRREAELVRNHHVIFLIGDDGDNDIELPDVDHDEFKTTLAGLGVPENRALELTRAARGGIPAFRRVAAIRGRVSPPWASHFKDSTIRRVWLAGGWNSRRSGDVEIIERLAASPYDELEDKVLPLTRLADPIFTAIGNTWSTVTPEASWPFVRPSISVADLRALEEATQIVLGAVDPALELSVMDRWRANVLGRSRVQSNDLRKGLAGSIALLGSRDERSQMASGQTGPGWARQVVTSLLDRANTDLTGHLWSSLADVLPQLAEAAPDAFLSAVERATMGDSPLARTLFIDQDSGFSVSSPHTGLLWALEGIAWSDTYFGQAVHVLARLAEIDPGGRLSNRPAASLRNILLPWFPQTMAPLSARIEALDVLVSRHAEVAWKLLINLLPKPHDIAIPSHTFSFREWRIDETERAVSDFGFREVTSAVASRLLDMVEVDPVKWRDLGPRIFDLSLPHRDQACRILGSIRLDTLTQVERAEIWESVDDVVRRHRTYSATDWARPDSELNKVEAAIAHIRPTDIVESNGWLFKGWHPDLGYRMLDDLAAYDADLVERRKEAIGQIYASGGLDEVLRLLESIDQYWPAGRGLAAQEGVAVERVLSLLESDSMQDVEFARGFVSGLTGWELDRLLPLIESLSGRPLAQARILTYASDHKVAWDYAKSVGQDVDREYWKEFHTDGLGDFQHATEAIEHLLSHDRPVAALDLISMYATSATAEIEPRAVIATIDSLLSTDSPTLGQLQAYGFEQSLQLLRDSDVDDDTLARLEWQLLPALGFEAKSPALDRQLASDPAMFVTVLSMFMRPVSDRDEGDVSEAVATNAYHLLGEWKLVPGADPVTGTVVFAELLAWVVEARRLLALADRAKIGDQYIGQMLVHAGAGEDGYWPDIAVRELLERVRSDDIDAGFQIGILNKRGVTTRGLPDGGRQEYALAAQYEASATALSVKWPHTASLLRHAETMYREEGQRQDEDAERFRQGLDRE